MAADTDPQYKTQDGSQLRIWQDAAQNNFWSEKKGAPVFDEVTYVEVISAGSASSSPVFEVRRVLNEYAAALDPENKIILGTQYAQYKNQIEDFLKEGDADGKLSGIPLKEWPEISRTLVASLRASNIFTVEALAALPDNKLQAVGLDGRTWRAKAQAYLKVAEDAASATAFAAEAERLRADLLDKDAQLVAMNAQIEALTAQMAALAGGKPAAPAKADPKAII